MNNNKTSNTKKGVGRPSKYTEEQQKRLVAEFLAATEDGMAVKDAAKALGVPSATLYTWRRDYEKKDIKELREEVVSLLNRERRKNAELTQQLNRARKELQTLDESYKAACKEVKALVSKVNVSENKRVKGADVETLNKLRAENQKMRALVKKVTGRMDKEDVVALWLDTL